MLQIAIFRNPVFGKNRVSCGAPCNPPIGFLTPVLNSGYHNVCYN